MEYILMMTLLKCLALLAVVTFGVVKAFRSWG